MYNQTIDLLISKLEAIEDKKAYKHLTTFQVAENSYNVQFEINNNKQKFIIIVSVDVFTADCRLNIVADIFFTHWLYLDRVASDLINVQKELNKAY